jgi:hypothetical protein
VTAVKTSSHTSAEPEGQMATGTLARTVIRPQADLALWVGAAAVSGTPSAPPTRSSAPRQIYPDVKQRQKQQGSCRVPRGSGTVRRFGGKYRLNLQGLTGSQMKKQALMVLPKRRDLSRLRGITNLVSGLLTPK